MSESEIITPRSSQFFIGNTGAEETITEALTSGKLHHAWLINGPKGVGKATLAYRIARFILSGGVEKDAGGGTNLFGEPEPVSLSIDENSETFQQIVQGSHPDLLVLETNEEETEIKVDDVRKINSFMRMTSANSGWKVVIVDEVDDMNRNDANAILKILEEPPAKSILLMISHSPGKLLPTIRSRCTHLKLKPLSDEDVMKVLEKTFKNIDREEAEFAVKVADGSPGTAADLYINQSMEVYKDLVNILKSLPAINSAAALKFSEWVAAKNAEAEWRTGNYLLQLLLSRVIKSLSSNENLEELVEEENNVLKSLMNSSPISLIGLYNNICALAGDAENLNLDRKMAMLNIINEIRAAA